MRTDRGYLFRACYGKGASHPPSLVLAETPRQAGQWESFRVEKRKASGMLSLEIVGMGKLEAG